MLLIKPVDYMFHAHDTWQQIEQIKQVGRLAAIAQLSTETNSSRASKEKEKRREPSNVTDLNRLDRVREEEHRLELRETFVHVRQRPMHRVLGALFGHFPLALLQATPGHTWYNSIPTNSCASTMYDLIQCTSSMSNKLSVSSTIHRKISIV